MILKESGSAPGVGPIHKDEIQATLAPLSKALGVDLYKNALGSVGKRQFSGDIDCAIAINNDDLESFGKTLQDHPLVLWFKKSSVFITKIKIQDYNPKRELIDPATGESKGVPDGRTGYVQVDFMPGEVDWMKTYYHSPSETESKYKGVFRNIMIATICVFHENNPSEEEIADGRPLEVERWMWSPTDGLVRIKRTPVPKANGDGYTKKNKNVVIRTPIKNPEGIASALGLNSAADLNSYESLKKAIKKNYKPEVVNNILDNFVNNRQVQDIGVPPDIKITKENTELDRIKELAGLTLNSTVMISGAFNK